MSVIKFPYDASRRVHSRKPRRSKNGTPEERAAATAAFAPAATVTEISRRSAAKSSAAKPGSFLEFMQNLRSYLELEFARGRTLDRIMDDLEETYERADKVLRAARGEP
jgi:phage tail tape-measure protein